MTAALTGGKKKGGKLIISAEERKDDYGKQQAKFCLALTLT
jgi:hypothetical protein